MTNDTEELHFQGQVAGERVITILRQHPFVLVEHALKVSLLLLLVLVVYRVIGMRPVISIVYPLLLLLAVTIAFRSWYGWWNTTVLLSDQRVVFVEQYGFTNRKISEALFSNIQFVTNEVKGLVHTVFNFGEVKIQTGGAVETLVIRQIPNPYEIQQRITKLQGQHIKMRETPRSQ